MNRFGDRMDRLVVGSVLTATVLVGLGFLALDWLFSMLDEMRGRSRDYGVLQMAEFVLLTTPRRVWELVPYVSLLGAVAGLSVLAGRSELVIIRGTGRSLGRIALAALLPALLLVGVGAVLAESVAPRAEAVAQTRKALARSGLPELRMRGGIWHREGELVTRARAMEPGGALVGVSQHRFAGDGRLEWLRESEWARPREALAAGRMRWQLEDVTVLRLGHGHVTFERHASSSWDSSADPAGLRRAALVDPHRLPVVDLRARLRGADLSRPEADRYRLALWQRSLQPLTVVVLVLLGAAFVFGPLREVTMGVRLAAGVALGLGFNQIQQLLAPASLVFGWPPAVAVGLPLLLALFGAAWLLRRAR